MNEVFTKKFWRDVKRTFDEAREGAPPEDHAIDAPAEVSPKTSSPEAAASSPSATSEQAKAPADE